MTNNDIVTGFDDEKDESLKIVLQKADGMDDCLILYLTGYIDTYNSKYFQKRILKTIESGFIKLIFNCSGLNYVSSTGIGSFTAFLKSVKPQGGDVVLLDIQPKVYEVFQLLGFSQFFNIKNTMEDSLGHFRKDATSGSSSVFPKIFSCPICTRKLRSVKPGRFRCSECKTILAIDNEGQVILG